jgi:hypothetical protein
MESKPEPTKPKMGIMDYVRWIAVGLFGAIILITVIMAAYRKFGG